MMPVTVTTVNTKLVVKAPNPLYTNCIEFAAVRGELDDDGKFTQALQVKSYSMRPSRPTHCYTRDTLYTAEIDT